MKMKKVSVFLVQFPAFKHSTQSIGTCCSHFTRFSLKTVQESEFITTVR